MTAVLGTVYFAVGGGGTDIGSFPGDDTGQAKTVSDFNLRNHHVRCSISLKNTAARGAPPRPFSQPPSRPGIGTLCVHSNFTTSTS